MKILLRLMMIITLASTSSACLTMPYDGQPVANTTDPISFGGYHLFASTPVTVFARNVATGAFEPVASTQTGAQPIGQSANGDLFAWGASAVLPPRFWEPGFRGYHAVVRADDDARQLMSVNEDWLQCWTDNGRRPDDFATHCKSPHSPEAHIYTTNYCATRPLWRAVSWEHVRIVARGRYRFGQMRVTIRTDHPVVARESDGIIGFLTARTPQGAGVHPASFSCVQSGAVVDEGATRRTTFLCEQMIGRDIISGGYWFVDDCEYLTWLHQGPELWVTPDRPLAMGTTCELPTISVEASFRAMIPASSVPSQCTVPPGSAMHTWHTIRAQCDCTAERAFPGPGGSPAPVNLPRAGNICVRDDENDTVKANIRCAEEVNDIISTSDGPGDDLRILSCTLRSSSVYSANQCILGG